MRQAIRQHLIVTYAISLGLMTASMSLLQPIPSASAQQLIGPVSQDAKGTGTQGRHIENIAPTLLYPTKSLEKKDAQTLTRKPHRLIRKPQSAPIASVEPSPSGSLPLSSLPPSLQSDNPTSQSKEPSSLNRSVGAAVPLATMTVAPSSTTTTRSLAAGSAPTGTIPLAAAGPGTTSTSGSGSAGGRSMSTLASEMPGLAQLISPPSVPVVSVNPAIGTSPTSLSFTAQQGGSNPTAQTLIISNTGGGTLSWSASDNAAWLTLSPASGTGNGAVTLTATTGTLTAGSYSGTVTMSATGASPVPVPVTFTVATAPVPPAIGASPTSLSFAATQSGANPATQTVTISNTGGGTLNWSAIPNTTWLAISPASGTGNGTATVSVTTGILTAGSYNGNITLSATGASNMTIPVTFTVTAAATISLSPTNLTYAATQGGTNPVSQTVALTNAGGVVNWTVSDSASWLSVSPASGSSSSTLTAAADTTGLSTGTYNGTITASATGSLSKTVAVTLTVNAPTTSSATLTWGPNTESDLAGYKVYQATASGTYGVALATLPAGTVTYQATGLSANTTYFFVITAYDSSGNESPFSNEVSKSIF
jgi:hypothetical protein